MLTKKTTVKNNQKPKAPTKYYVTMTDKFMSGWGPAQGKINKLVILCDSYEEAEIVAENARNRSDQKYINITSRTPSYGPGYFVSWHSKATYPEWFKKGNFKK